MSVARFPEAFGFDVHEARPFGSGLIHETWIVETKQGSYLVQRLNGRVFADPGAVAENAAGAAVRVDMALAAAGDEDPRHRLRYRMASGGRIWVRDAAGDVWRCAIFIPDSRPAGPEEAREAARLLGQFPGLVAGATLPDPALVFPGFHDTPARNHAFEVAVATKSRNRQQICRHEIDRLEQCESLASALIDRSLPTRLVHNDAKLDNVLVDAATGRGLCVIDLDTVMPGLAPHDFGDLVRSTVTGRPEDEADLDAVTIRSDLFERLTAGYLEGAADWITQEERASLVEGALVITYEQALRFLTDFLLGDAYYPVDDGEHNLRRARAQIRLLELLLEAKTELEKVVRGLSPSTGD